MFSKFTSALNVFRKGSEVANVEAWKTRQITGTVVGGFILAMVNLASVLNYPLPIDIESANAIGGGIVAIANIMLTAATSKRAGILPATEQTSKPGSEGVSHVGITEETRTAALQYVNKPNTLEGLDTTYYAR